VIRVFVGFRCNNRCGFCAQGELSSRETDPDVSEALDTILPGAVVAFLGGEPTLYDGLITWVSAAREKGGTDVIIQTNGRRLSEPGYARRLIDAGVSRFEIAIQGSTAPMHDFQTGVLGSFVRTGVGLRRAKGEGAKVTTTTVVTRSNYRHLPEIVDACRALGASAAALRLALPLGRARGGSPPLVPPPSLAEPYMARAVERAKKAGFSCKVMTTDSEDYVGLGPVDSTPRS
jgi:MoaA/NifB/PqqE/SkfB family radical SAM enzyme